MKSHIPTNRGGLVLWVLIIVVALLALSYYGFSLRNLVNAPVTQDNFGYVATTTVTFWDKYLNEPASYLWNDVFINLIWDPGIKNLTEMKNSQPTDLSSSSPTIPLPSQPLVN
jgi:hypothetical protein